MNDLLIAMFISFSVGSYITFLLANAAYKSRQFNQTSDWAKYDGEIKREMLKTLQESLKTQRQINLVIRKTQQINR